MLNDSYEINEDTACQPSKAVEKAPLLQVISEDPYLSKYAPVLLHRQHSFQARLEEFQSHHGSFLNFASAYSYFGFNPVFDSQGVMAHPIGWVYREYAPNATTVNLIGDFNQWNPSSHKLTRINDFGVWEIHLPAACIPDGSKVRIHMTTGQQDPPFDRISPWARRVVQNQHESILYQHAFYEEDYVNPFHFHHPKPNHPTSLRIYEAHIGIASNEPKIASYDEFTHEVLPRIVQLGYNTLQLMGIPEHAYYASFGYQVTSFYAPSSRFGPPNALRGLIDRAHELGLLVLLDLVHSHASKNVLDGLNLFDGSTHCYFHGGERGDHPLWDSRLFNYGNYETLRFLLSNINYWIDLFHVDGFRFDGVTSMIYLHHGMSYSFSGHYDEYFGDDAGPVCVPMHHARQVDHDALVYLMLANHLCHEKNVMTIAEEVSGMPTLARPLSYGGLGFDYRLSMALPDVWIKYLKHYRDEEWNLGHLVHTLSNRRYLEKHVSYCESHDQALVGDKTIAFWLMDKEMYGYMSDLMPLTPIIDRGLALHKMIRLITFGLGGEAYLNFIGNEFGHPEWLDFPRAGNQDSYHYARRQWSLVDDPLLRYKYLNRFDEAMQHLDKAYSVLGASHQYVSLAHESDKLIVFEKGKCVFVFNFHPSQSYTSYRIGVYFSGMYRLVLDTDDSSFGGHGRMDPNVKNFSDDYRHTNRPHSILIYSPCRSAQVYYLDI
ncbi:1,4-alpha-glucan branching enzyme [Coelomomyces lativittatus]|nr:1,4-alpha-glucan branching enzyme [Coelomomyces lativittatus]